MRKLTFSLIYLTLAFSQPVAAETDKYVIDTRGKHAFIQFKISHFGFSYVLGRFDKFKGAFCYDPDNPAAAHVSIQLDVSSLNTGHAERDKHLRDQDYLDTKTFETASFVSTGYQQKDNSTALLSGNLTLHGVTKMISLKVTPLGMGDDPWGRYRAGFEGEFKIVAADYGLNYLLGDAAKMVDVYVTLEGERSKYAKIDCPIS